MQSAVVPHVGCLQAVVCMLSLLVFCLQRESSPAESRRVLIAPCALIASLNHFYAQVRHKRQGLSGDHATSFIFVALLCL